MHGEMLDPFLVKKLIFDLGEAAKRKISSYSYNALHTGTLVILTAGLRQSCVDIWIFTKCDFN